MTEKIPISGGPHTGKTTLLEALKERFPNAYFVDEPATNVINRELAAEHRDPAHQPRVPWIDYSKFGPLVAAESEKLEGEIPCSAKMAFLDRSLVDTIAYCRLNGFDEYIPAVWRMVYLARYSFALICQPVGDYAATAVRRETVDEATLTHAAIVRAYGESRLDVVTIPPVSVVDRVNLIAKTLRERDLTE